MALIVRGCFEGQTMAERWGQEHLRLGKAFCSQKGGKNELIMLCDSSMHAAACADIPFVLTLERGLLGVKQCNCGWPLTFTLDLLLYYTPASFP